ncbi:MAG: SIMPL domain-containing protein, partial [Acidobacteriota bacterium]|nr:SIMPL domain-containing protein [Acidobacteriota bacterium]
MSSPIETSSPRRAPGLPKSRLGVVIVIVVAAVALYAVGRTSSSRPPTRTIFVTGSGTATSVPDTVTFQLGVTTLRVKALDALHVNNLRVRALEKALEAQGVKKKNLQTSGLSIYQTTNQFGTPTGFSVSDTLQVITHNFTHAGSAIDAAVAAVGNGVTFNGVSFSQSNQSAALTQARAKAIEAARRAAATLARAAHL